MSQPELRTAHSTPPVQARPGPPPLEAADLLLLLTTLIWGVNYAVVKYALVDLIPLNFSALRLLMATLIMLAFTFASGRDLRVPRADFWRLCALGFLANVIYQMLFIYGMKLTSAGDASIILATAPIFTAIIGRIRRAEFFGVRAVVGLVLAFVGMAVLVSYGGWASAKGSNFAGNCILVFAAIGWASYTVATKRFSHAYGSIKSTTLVMATGTPMLLIFSIPTLVRQDWHAVRLASWGGVAFSAVFSISIAYIIWSYGVQKIGPTRTAIYSNVTPIATLLAAWAMLGERPLPGQIVGAAVVLAGVYMVRKGMTFAPTEDPIEEVIEEESLRPGTT
jgi:drug/metabolite transporter (DMT)-like permease